MLYSNFILLCYSVSSQTLSFFRSLQEQCGHFRLKQINYSSSSRSQIQTYNTHTFSPCNLRGRKTWNWACESVPPKQLPAPKSKLTFGCLSKYKISQKRATVYGGARVFPYSHVKNSKASGLFQDYKIKISSVQCRKHRAARCSGWPVAAF